MGLSILELEKMDFGQALDYMAEYVAMHSDNKKQGREVKASQTDFDSF